MVLVPSRRAGRGAASSPNDGELSQGNCAPVRPIILALARAGRDCGTGSPAARGGLGLDEGQDRDREGLDVPHHVAVIVVIVVPGRQTEDRGRRARRGVDRAVEIEERRVGQGLPARLGADQPDPAFPDLVPGRAVLGADDVEAVVPRLGDHATGLLVGSAVQGAGHEAGDLAQAVGRPRPRPEGVGADQARGVQRRPDRLDRPPPAARHLGDIGQAHPPQRPGRLPQQHAVARGLGLARRVAQKPQGAPQHARRGDAGPDLQVAGAVDLKAISWQTRVGSSRLAKVSTVQVTRRSRAANTNRLVSSPEAKS
jgi:hypothetical protein